MEVEEENGDLGTIPEDVMDGVITHTFFPKRLPNCESNDLEDIDEALLKCISFFTAKVCRTFPRIEQTASDFRHWATLQPGRNGILEDFKFVEDINQLQVGSTLALYVRNQNCTILFTKVKDTLARVMTFRASLPNRTIMSMSGSLKVEYPETSNVIPISELLLSSCFAKQMFGLCLTPCPLAQPVSRKARQEFEEKREPPNPIVVSDFIVSMLNPVNPETYTEPMQHHVNLKVTKKLRDQISWNNAYLPFRRSGLWISAKVVLQLSLTEKLGKSQDALLTYKVVLLDMLTHICEEYFQRNPLNVDLVTQTINKLARRASKLTKMKTSTEPLESLKQATLTKTFDVIDNIHENITRNWKIFSKSTRIPIGYVPFSYKDMDSSLPHNIQNLKAYLLETANPEVAPTINGLNRIDTVNRNLSMVTLLERNNRVSASGDVHLNERSVWIYDVELFVKHHLQTSYSSTDIFCLLRTYTQQVVGLYGQTYNDPAYFSKMIITVLKCVQVLDEIAVNRYPLLKNYDSGVDPHLFQNLILLHKEDMNMLEKLCDYFHSRNRAAQLPSLIKSSEMSWMDFSVQYATNNPAMLALKNQILRDQEEAIRRKHDEVRDAKAECDRLSSEISRASCQHRWDGFYQQHVHVTPCRKCNLESQLKSKKTSVGYYQRLLPNHPNREYLQDGVVFELLIPQEIACLRDTLRIFIGEIYGITVFGSMTSNRIHEPWHDFLRTYKRNVASYTMLGSTLKQTLVSHYGRSRPNVIYTSVDGFILDNGLTCNYYANPFLNFVPSERLFTYQIQHASEFGPYAELQFSLDKTTPPRHTENEVISKQYKCHAKLSLEEFISFGSVRCGHRIQLRNLFTGITKQNLSLEYEPVLALIMQTLWEVGPAWADEPCPREIHVDFTDEEFCLEYLRLMENTMKANEKNWSCPLIMMSIVMITTRILELGPSCEVRSCASKLLNKCRIILGGWCKKLENIISKLEDSNKREAQELSSLLLQVNLCSAFTFNVSSEDLMPYVIVDEQDVTFWVSTVSSMYHLVVREKVHERLSKLLQNLVRHARHGIPLNILNYLHKNISQGFQESLHNFACMQWELANRSVAGSWERCGAPKDHAYVNTYYQTREDGTIEEHIVHVDILRGTFLVDGYPPSHLPEDITRDPHFQRFFRTCAFRVQRDTSTFITIDKYLDQHYAFFKSKSGKLVIRQQHDNYYLVLLPHGIFTGHVSNHWIDNFTHWYHSGSKETHFYQRTTSDHDPMPECTLYPSQDTNNNYEQLLLKCVQSEQHFVSIKSDKYAHITNLLTSLEDAEFIDVLVDKGEVNVKLRRLNLSFQLNNGKLWSNNYSGFCIANNQNMGTLVGLESGLCLEKETKAEPSGYKKIFIIRHSLLGVCQKRGTTHQTAFVASGIRKPPLFTYEVDQTLRRLKASNDKSAWLYLAALHAYTSSPLPDPFIQLTGTEMAMWILKSGFVWSCSPYDSECLETIDMIRRLSPERSYYPSHLRVMEQTTWPTGFEMNSYAAYDGYDILLNKLIDESTRLQDLFQNSKIRKNEINSGGMLQNRGYWAQIHLYSPHAHVDENDSDRDQTTGYQQLRHTCSSNCTILAELRMTEKAVQTPGMSTLSTFLKTCNEVPCRLDDTLSNKMINDWFQLDLRSNWLRLYALAFHMDKNELAHEFTFIMGAMIYTNNGEFHQIIHLHNISQLASIKTMYNIPECISSGVNFVPTSNQLVESDISSILKSASIPFSREPRSYDTYSEYETAKREYDNNITREVANSRKQISSYWPHRKSIDRSLMATILSGKNLRLDRILGPINDKFAFWHNNRDFTIFVDQIEEQLRSATENGIIEIKALTAFHPNHQISHAATSVTRHDLEESTLLQQFTSLDEQRNELNDSLRLAEKLFAVPSTLDMIDAEAVSQRQAYLSGVGKIEKALESVYTQNQPVKALYKTGILRRLAPVTLLSTCMTKNMIQSIPEDMANYYTVNFTGALAVLFSRIMRLNRIISYEETAEKLETFQVELGRERESTSCANWSPLEYPEWLLLELDLDITIRPIQVQVARHMMTMAGRNVKNGVMQLNMGEGKTSVIVPMIVTSLPTKEMLCRVTVLNSIFATNQNLLTFTIGGLLNRRVYTVPCNRSLDIRKCLTQIEATYEECRRLKGVIITLPEYRLSFRLMAYNSFLLGKASEAKRLFEIEEWLRAHVRDIVDESDEIYSVKYQLIYTTGKQLKIDGGNMRWRVCQKLLQLLRPIASILFDKYGQNAIEFNTADALLNPEQFTHFRILSDVCKQDLYKWVADAILEGKGNFIGGVLNTVEKELIREFLVNEDISQANHEAVLASSFVNEEKKQTLLLLSGFLRSGILYTALTKRWRVEYGVNTNENSTKLMAVPFRAKDVAAERTEFGHPDMAIVLTQLSYYYSGVNEKQLKKCFELLKTLTGSEALYNTWIKGIPDGKQVDDSIKNYRTINLMDYEQWTKHLYPQLKNHTAVIDFWLENVVYPKESKQFPGKIVTNAWDLCYERCAHPTTGFSGTNDSSLLLPANISQEDLEELKDTNIQLEGTLRQPENMYKRTLKMGAKCSEVLELMKEDNLRILIDAGALMLELGNEQIAQLWLDLDHSLEGVVYFTDNNDLVIKLRVSKALKKNPDVPLKLSPYRDRMDKCAVYLDDQHTRGTDLKFPTNFKACVTVGSRMRRDKLMQACMRMRKLGKGQSVHFYLSHEVQNKILEMKASYEMLCDSEVISVDDILKWVCNNSQQFEKDSLPYWADSGRNYAQKLAADDLYLQSDKLDKTGNALAKQCEDMEILTLKDVYGVYHTKQRVVDIIPRGFSKITKKLSGTETQSELPENVSRSLRRLENTITEKCKVHIPNVSFYHSLLEEEQEKELEPEPEVQEEVERPPQETPLKPSLHQDVISFVLNGGKLAVKNQEQHGIVRLGDIFQNSTFWCKIQSEFWGEQGFATEDSTRVIVSRAGDKLDSFLRPMSYILSSYSKDTGQSQILLISQFEANELMPYFRNPNGVDPPSAKVVLHMFSGRRLEGQSTLANTRQLQLPIGSRGTILGEDTLAPYLIASGNLFYESMEEQKAFSRFLGLMLKPWTEKENEAFDKNKMTRTGFVLPMYKADLGMTSLFTDDPTGMVFAILKCRHDVMRDTDHTIRMLEECSYVIS